MSSKHLQIHVNFESRPYNRPLARKPSFIKIKQRGKALNVAFMHMKDLDNTVKTLQTIEERSSELAKLKSVKRTEREELASIARDYSDAADNVDRKKHALGFWVEDVATEYLCRQLRAKAPKDVKFKLEEDASGPMIPILAIDGVRKEVHVSTLRLSPFEQPGKLNVAMFDSKDKRIFNLMVSSLGELQSNLAAIRAAVVAEEKRAIA